MPEAALATVTAKSKAPPKPAAAKPATAQVKAPAAAAIAPAGPAITLKSAKSAQDPRFKLAMDKLAQRAAKARSHPPAGAKAAEAQAAALPPPNEKLADAQKDKVAGMGAAPTGKPEPQSFLAMLRAEIQKVMPKKTEDAKGFMKGEDRRQLKGAMTGNVSRQKGEATAGMKAASEAEPDTSRSPGKVVRPMRSEAPPAQPPAVGADEAMPEQRPAADVSLEQGKKNTEKLMTDAEIAAPQMQKANDSRFTAVVTSKNKADQFASAGPKQYRVQEQGVLRDAAAKALTDEKKGLAAFRGETGKAQQGVRARQLSAKEKDELERKKAADDIQSMFNKTKDAVDLKLANLDKEVESLFDKGADAAVAKMKDYVESRFDDRYSGVIGKGRWVKDKLMPLPPEVKAWFDQAHKVFLAELDAVVVRVAGLVEQRLKEAKDEIARGQEKIRSYVDGLPDNLKSVGLAAEREMKGRFDELRQGVEDKKNDLAQKLAQRYKDACDKGEKALQEMKDAHKSLYERVRDAIAEVVKILREFKAKIMGMLRKSKNAIDLIAADPIGFLKNLLKALGKGLGQFVDNIWTHLKAGFMAFLFGSLAETGVAPPKDLSMPSLLMLVLQVLGLTYERIRAKVVKLLGERAVSLIEKVAAVIKELITGGPARLWEMMAEYVGNLKAMVIDAMQDWLIATIIKAAVTKLVMMFNPVGAIIQAIITIYNVVMFFIERINQILAFVESVINSALEIAMGNIGAAANWIEKALARTVPLIIAFLARLLGISGITEKIVSVIRKIQAKVDQAIDKVIGKIVGMVSKVIGTGKAMVGKAIEWWKQRKPFTLKSGEKHEIFYSGDEKDPIPMVASKTAKPVKKKLEEFDNQASQANASEEEKKGKSLIANTQKAVQKDPGDSNLVVNLKQMLEIYEGAGAAKKTKTTHKTGSLGGDTVGLEMEIDWLGPDHAQGTPPQSGVQSKLMGLLVTNPHEKSPYKYIRGHLLNHNLGGKGEAYNMFPITGKANSQHLRSTESDVKKWVGKNHWVKYEVKVQSISSKLDASSKYDNYVNCTFACHAIQKDAKGSVEQEFSSKIGSVFQKEMAFERTDIKKKET